MLFVHNMSFEADALLNKNLWNEINQHWEKENSELIYIFSRIFVLKLRISQIKGTCKNHFCTTLQIMLYKNTLGFEIKRTLEQ